MDYPSVVSHLPALRLLLGMMFLEGTDASLYLFIRIQCMVNPHMVRLWMGLNKQTASAKGFYFPYNLPCMLRMALRVTAPRNNRCFPQVWCGTNRTKFRVFPVCASAWMRFIACLNLGNLFLCHTVYNYHLVSHVGCHLDISLCSIPATVVHESLCLYLCNFQVLYISIVNRPYIP